MSESSATADFAAYFQQVGENFGAAVRKHYGPAFAALAAAAPLLDRETVERARRRARQRENARDFRRTAATAQARRGTRAPAGR